MKISCFMHFYYTDRKNVTDFLYLVLHLACKVTCYFRLFSSVLVSVLRTSINVLLKSKSKNYVTWIANLTKLFLSVYFGWNDDFINSFWNLLTFNKRKLLSFQKRVFMSWCCSCHSFVKCFVFKYEHCEKAQSLTG